MSLSLMKPLSLALCACLFSGCGESLLSSLSSKKQPDAFDKFVAQQRAISQKASQEQAQKEKARLQAQKPKSEKADDLFQFAFQKYQEMLHQPSSAALSKSYIDKNHVVHAYIDPDKVCNLFEDAAKKGSAEAYRYMGIMNRDEDKLGAAIDYFQTAAEKGSVEALADLGEMYLRGKSESTNALINAMVGGVPKDYAKAMDYFQKAASKGSALGAYDAGALYAKGLGVPKDFAKAKEYFQKASDGENAEASYYLGTMYYKGEGVVKDLAKAVEFFKKASDGGG